MRVVQYTVAHLSGQVEPCAILFQLFHQGGGRPPEDVSGGLLPHQTLAADPMPGEAEMARVLADVSLDVQIVPLEKQVMVLFGWYGGNLALYYDPVLDCFSGYALQQ